MCLQEVVQGGQEVLLAAIIGYCNGLLGKNAPLQCAYHDIVATISGRIML
jgi:hypothetical protein